MQHEKSGPVIVRWKTPNDDSWVRDYLDRQWGGPTMLLRGIPIDVRTLPTLIAGDRHGIAVFREGEPAELVLLEAFVRHTGIGSLLLEAVIAELRARGSENLRVSTTNDNLSALRFYQRRGFALRELRVRGVDIARRIKPSIPDIGENGIPMTDELELELAIPSDGIKRFDR